MNGLVRVDTPDAPADKQIDELIQLAEDGIELASERLDPISAQSDATIALARIALATFLRGDR